MKRNRSVTKQKHSRFNVEAIVTDITVDDCRRSLFGGSVKLSSATTYDSRMRTLGRYLVKARLDPDAHPATCSEEEFWKFLYNWKLQGMAPASGVRSALLLEQRAMGGYFLSGGGFHALPSFLEKADVKLATKASGVNSAKVDKGVLDVTMHGQWQVLVLSSDDTDIDCGAACRTCLANAVTHLRNQMLLAVRLMLAAPIRPGDLLNLRFADLLQLDTLQLNIFDPKVNGHNRVPCGPDGVAIFLEAREYTSRDYVFPRCISKHLERSLRLAELMYEWPEGLVFTPHCLRHTFMAAQQAKVHSAVLELVTGVTCSTANHYGRTNADRTRAETWFTAIDSVTGNVYYYSASGLVSWSAPF